MKPESHRSTLFVSSDLVGSTAYKQKSEGWQKIFLSFYRELPQAVADADREIGDGGTTSFELWKAIGDELVFQVHVASETEVSRAVRVWLLAMSTYEKQVLSDIGLALKGGGFIATFPGPDSESTIPRDPKTEDSDAPVVLLNRGALKGRRAHSKYHYDYFGPSIDTGFRLSGLSSRRFFTMSVEVAWAIAAAAQQAANHKTGEDLHSVADFVFRGSYELKGVWNNREYPVFAIDREQSDEVHQALAKINATSLDPQAVIDVCHACSQDPTWPSRLYLPDSSNAAFTTKPIDAMKALYESETSVEGAETPAPSDDGDELAAEPPLGSTRADR